MIANLNKQNFKEKEIYRCLRGVMDPELHVNIVDLGLVYKVDLDKKGLCTLTITLTTPGCPLMPVIEAMIRQSLRRVGGIREVRINLTFDPPWDASKMSPSVATALGF